jgi:hypothetical protein
MQISFTTLKRSSSARLLCLLFVATLFFASCRDRHLCPAYPYKSKKGVENMARTQPSQQENS